VQRIAGVRPDVVLVERTVAQSAKADFEARGISLAFNVKRELLERLARGLGTRVGGGLRALRRGVAWSARRRRGRSCRKGCPAVSPAAAAAAASPCIAAARGANLF
jgi:hypothetical protein